MKKYVFEVLGEKIWDDDNRYSWRGYVFAENFIDATKKINNLYNGYADLKSCEVANLIEVEDFGEDVVETEEYSYRKEVDE